MLASEGRSTATVTPASRGSTPARNNDDLPTPDGPTTHTTGAVRTSFATRSDCSSRPKNISASCSSNGRSARNGGSRSITSANSGHAASSASTVIMYPSLGGAPVTRRTTMPTAASRSGPHTAVPEKPCSSRASRPGSWCISTHPVATGPARRP
ncbi:hypothetical protein BBK82_42085 [Lentzea guizhouensis]|uniref:Uncharacterized protein n=1 Tax=Lentzea guizhouensis TaxID=1586287 RepID=A0A1B2HUZ6_9PSEU|nr:hypothetical protein [Lentzea guizhouensis]ANZ41570.1 hypothetical protein BBK82_42085 [Lentzea guizhouensis]